MPSTGCNFCLWTAGQGNRERSGPAGKLSRIRKCPADAAGDTRIARAGSRNSYSSDRLSGLNAGNRAETSLEVFLFQCVRIPLPEFTEREKRRGFRIRGFLREVHLIGPQDVLRKE